MTVRFSLPRPVRLTAAALAVVLLLASCSSDALEDGLSLIEDPDSAASADTDAESPDAEGEGGDADDESPEDPVTTEGPTSTTVPDDDDESAAPESPPGTVNDLDDLIGNENDDGLDGQGDGTRVDRFVAAFVANQADLDVTEPEARCAAELLEAQLSATSFELLIDNLVSNNSVNEGAPFTDAELLVIAESLADCVDFRLLVDELVSEISWLGDIVDCLAREVGVDEVEALVLLELIGGDEGALSAPLFLEGFDSCPDETRAAVDEVILEQFLLADGPAIEACLATVSDAELRPFFETREFSELVLLLREQCLF